jgi:ribosomal-protein-alanine N-acetyltransferase
MLELRTDRLRLIALNQHQLNQYLADPEELEQDLGFPVSRLILTPIVRQAIKKKIAKMALHAEATHPWYTYWLIVVSYQPYGAGLAGFKGYPDGQGEAEIGYGIDPGYQRRGYTTEAVRALITWAFEDPNCRSVIAPGTLKSNIASNRVLAKVGMYVYEETDDTLSWRIVKGNGGTG